MDNIKNFLENVITVPRPSTQTQIIPDGKQIKSQSIDNNRDIIFQSTESSTYPTTVPVVTTNICDTSVPQALRNRSISESSIGLDIIGSSPIVNNNQNTTSKQLPKRKDSEPYFWIM